MYRYLIKFTSFAVLLSLFSVVAPAQVTKPSEFNFAVYGDNRSGYSTESAEVHKKIIQKLKALQPQLIINTGDLVYRGEESEDWDAFFKESGDLFKKIKFYPAIGNHDVSKDNIFRQHFPFNEEGVNYYNFQHQGAQFIILDSTIAIGPGSLQYQYLIDKLQSSSQQKPLFIVLHHPPFNRGRHGSDLDLQQHLAPIFAEYGVDIVFAGHDHNYQRFKPIRGVHYIVSGGGGGPLYGIMNNEALASAARKYHYVTIRVKDAEISVQTLDLADNIIDHFKVQGDVAPKAEALATALPTEPAVAYKLWFKFWGRFF